MLTRRVALEALAFAIAISAFSCFLHAAEPARRWRPATAADLPAGTPIQSATLAGAGLAPVDSAAQRVQIDPATGAIVPAADASTEAAANADIDAGAPRLVLQKSPSGALYVDTSGYRHTATVTLDAQGQPRLDCTDPPQDAASAARLAGRAAPAAPGDHSAHAHALAPAPPDPAGAAAVPASATAAKAEARQQRLAAAVAASDVTAASPAAASNDRSSPAHRPASAGEPGAASTAAGARPEPRQPGAALQPAPANPAPTSTPAEQ